MTGLS